MRGDNGMREHDDIEAALAAALRPTDVDDASTRAAVTAFRTARDTGLHTSRRTRRREDWRPASERRRGRSLKTALAALFASLTLGGVAIAAAVPLDLFDETEAREPTPHRSTSAPLPSEEPASPRPEPPLAGSSPPPRAPATHPVPHAIATATATTTQSASTGEPLCRAYEKALGHGKAMEAAAWKRLVAAAGGKDVLAYCDSLPTSEATAPPPVSGNKRSDPLSKSPFDIPAAPEAGDATRHPHAPAGDTPAAGRGR
ncbi:hypothetical protein ACIBG6_07660 [Streptomyces sp. NPDC050842]|uniref:hypothetical protein n=1 Tax=Streptomyces sp. NPDC050842 TaxID=3365636 RepID=UPI00379A8110